MGRIVKYHAKQVPNLGQVLDAYVKYLPLRDDEDEAPFTHAVFCDFIEEYVCEIRYWLGCDLMSCFCFLVVICAPS